MTVETEPVVDGLIQLLWGWLAVRTYGRVKRGTGTWVNRASGALMIGAVLLPGAKDIGTEQTR